MLEVVWMEQIEAALIALISEVPESVPVPRIEFREAVLAETVPSGSLAAPSERLLVEWRADVSIMAAFANVIVSAAIIPESIVVFKDHDS